MENEQLIEIIKKYESNTFFNSDYFKELKTILNNNLDICCFFDCDGVLFNTIEVSFKEMGLDHKVEITDDKMQEKISEYYRKVDWYDLILRSEEINNSCQNLLFLKELNIFKYMAIATHRHTFLNEGLAKKRIFEERANGIPVLDIPFKIKKHFAVQANGNILVDDSKRKIIEWVNNGGIGVLFDKDFSDFQVPTLENPYFKINNLLDLGKVMYILKICYQNKKNFHKTKKKHLI